MGFLGSSAGKESACNAGDSGSIPGSGRSPGEGIGYPLQYSWASLVAQMVKNPPAMQETWVQSLGWEDPWRRAWQPTLVFLPREFRRQRNLAGYSPWGCKELDTLSNSHFHFHDYYKCIFYRQYIVQFSSVQMLNRFRLFATP